jgi:transglutaminase-like putative cysteine protease
LSAGRSPGYRNPGTRTWTRLTLFGTALLLGFASLGPLLDGWGWWLITAVTVLVPLVAIGIASRVSRRPWVPLVAGFGAAIATLSFGYARDVSAVALIPTGDTFARWAQLVRDGTDSIATQRSPADATEGILFLLGILAVVAVTFFAPALDRVPAVAALPLLVVLDIPVAVRAGEAEPVWFVLVAAAYLALLRVGRRRMPLPTVAVTAAVVVAGSLLLPAFFPDPPEAPRPTGAGIGTGLNPLIDLGDDLRRNDDVRALTYRSDASGGLYLRLATFDEFTGITWLPDSSTEPENTVDDFPTPQGLADEVPRAPYTAEIEIGDVTGRWLPLPYPATAVTGLDGTWAWDADGLTVRSESSNARGQHYEVQFLDVEPDAGQLTVDLPAQIDDRYLQEPNFVPQIIRDTAQAVAGTGSTYEKAIALQTFFADGDFTYSIETPVEQNYDGTGVGVIERFLEVKSGYCIHFASAMALMAREVGIPSRMVVGFLPGSRDSTGTGRDYIVSSDDLHAWPELYFEGIGWLRFEPTPGRGSLPDYSSLAAVDDPATPEFEGQNPDAAPAVAPTTAPTTTPTERPVEDDPVQVTRQDPTLVVLSLVAALLVIMLALPAATRVAIRWRRMRRVLLGDAAAAWAEIRDTAHDHEWSAPDSETPRQLGTRLAAVVGPGAVETLQAGVESAAYDRPGSRTMTVDEVDALRRAIAAAAPFGVRVRAVFLPPSLVARFRPSE